MCTFWTCWAPWSKPVDSVRPSTYNTRGVSYTTEQPRNASSWNHEADTGYLEEEPSTVSRWSEAAGLFLHFAFCCEYAGLDESAPSLASPRRGTYACRALSTLPQLAGRMGRATRPLARPPSAAVSMSRTALTWQSVCSTCALACAAPACGSSRVLVLLSDGQADTEVSWKAHVARFSFLAEGARASDFVSGRNSVVGRWSELCEHVDFDDQSPYDTAHCRQVRSVMHLISSAWSPPSSEPFTTFCNLRMLRLPSLSQLSRSGKNFRSEPLWGFGCVMSRRAWLVLLVAVINFAETQGARGEWLYVLEYYHNGVLSDV